MSTGAISQDDVSAWMGHYRALRRRHRRALMSSTMLPALAMPWLYKPWVIAPLNMLDLSGQRS